MLFLDHVRLASHNLMLHKIRSVLTSLGIIFGVGSVISMLSISEGAKRQALSQIESMGIDKIIVYTKKPPAAGKDVSKSSSNSFLEAYGLTEADLRHLEGMDNIDSISTALNTRRRVLKGTKRLDSLLVAVSPDFLEASRSAIVKGRWLEKFDYDAHRSVCVIGRDAARRLFTIGEKDVIGSIVRIEESAFHVLGVLENTCDTQILGVGSPNDMIVIPMSTADALYSRTAYQNEGSGQRTITRVSYDTFIAKVKDVAFIDHTAKRIAAYMDKTHQSVKDWSMLVPLELLKQREQTQNIFTIVMSSIAGISLLVGGVGIMNIMLANVYERRREIGTRRALGAKKSDILIQFLMETVFLTSIGGVSGVALGILISEVVTRYAQWPTSFSLWYVCLALAISAGVGIIFGTYPAWKAAQQNPIDVLRAE